MTRLLRDPSPATVRAAAEAIRALGEKLRAREPAVAEGVAEEQELESTDEASVVGSRPNLVASFPPHVQLKLGDEVPVSIDTKNLHFFDEGSGEPLR